MIKYQFEYDLDDVRTNLAHREIILQKEFFKRIYEKWYSEFVNASKISPPGIFMINVFHLIPDAAAFLKEAMRTLKSAGKIILIEPASSFWGRIIYGNLHHEPFDPKGNWTIPSTGTLSGANIALPWIVFERDKTEFKKSY